MKPKKILQNRSGLVMVGIIVLVVISAIAFSTAMYLVSTTIDQTRIDATNEILDNMESAIVGHPNMFHNDAGSDLGHFTRAETFPANLGAITTTDLLSSGVIETVDPTEDAYGNSLVVSTGATFTLESYGKDGANAGGDDIERTFTEVNYEACDISMTVYDASNSTNTDASYVVTGGAYNGHVYLDDGDIDVGLVSAPFPAGTGDAPDRYTANEFQWDDAPYGWNQVYIVPDNPADIDPDWASVSGNSARELSFLIFVPPTPSGTRRHFNIVYPCHAVLNSIQPGHAASYCDKTVDSSGTNWSAKSDYWGGAAQNYEYQCVGYGNPDATTGVRTMRALIKFNLTSFANLAATSKITSANLRLWPHISGGSGRSTGAGKVCVYRYTGASGWTAATSHTWANMASYSDLQDSENFEAGGLAALAAGDYMTFDVTEAVQKWNSATWANGGFLIRLQASDGGSGGEAATNYYSFKSQESATTTVRPKLYIRFYR